MHTVGSLHPVLFLHPHRRRGCEATRLQNAECTQHRQTEPSTHTVVPRSKVRPAKPGLQPMNRASAILLKRHLQLKRARDNALKAGPSLDSDNQCVLCLMQEKARRSQSLFLQLQSEIRDFVQLTAKDQRTLHLNF